MVLKLARSEKGRHTRRATLPRAQCRAARGNQCPSFCLTTPSSSTPCLQPMRRPCHRKWRKMWAGQRIHPKQMRHLAHHHLDDNPPFHPHDTYPRLQLEPQDCGFQRDPLASPGHQTHPRRRAQPTPLDAGQSSRPATRQTAYASWRRRESA